MTFLCMRRTQSPSGARALQLSREALAQFFLPRFAVFLQASNLRRELLFQRFGLLEFACGLRLLNLVFEKDFSLGNLSPDTRINLGDLFFVIVSEGAGRTCVLQSLDRLFVG